MPSIENSGPALKRFLLICGLLCLPGLSGCFDFSGQRTRNRDRLLEERENLSAEVRKSAALFNERDQLRQQLNNLEAQLEQLATVKKQMETKK